MQMMTAAVCTDIEMIEIQKRPVPVIKDDEVLLHVRHIGICGSDLHFYRAGGPNAGGFPKVLGHECAGVIEAVGSMVTGFETGDRVCVEPGVPCGECEFCLQGRYNLCEDIRFLSAFDEDGCMCEYIAFPAKNCFHLPDSVSTLEGALIEPFAVGLHAVSRSEIHAGQTAAIYGAGCIGLMTLMALRLQGVVNIYVADKSSRRLDMAAELGATVEPAQSLKALVDKMTGGRGVDVSFDCTGSVDCVYALPSLTKRGGRAVVVGNLGRAAMFDYFNFYEKELTILGVFRYRDMFPRALKAIEDGRVNPSCVVTNVCALDKVPDTMRALVHGETSGVKTVIRVPDRAAGAE